jgi:hypothetical protein
MSSNLTKRVNLGFLMTVLIMQIGTINPLSGQAEKKNFSSRNDLEAHQAVFNKRLKMIYDYISERMTQLSPYLKVLKKSYKGDKFSLVINEYPFGNSEKKYFRQKQMAEVEVNGDAISKVNFIIENVQVSRGSQFTKSFITDNSPLDKNFEDLRIKYVDFIMPNNNYEQKISDITDMETKVFVMEQILGYYKNLIKAIENNYYYFQSMEKINQQKMIGIDAY